MGVCKVWATWVPLPLPQHIYFSTKLAPLPYFAERKMLLVRGVVTRARELRARPSPRRKTSSAMRLMTEQNLAALVAYLIAEFGQERNKRLEQKGRRRDGPM